MINSIYECLLCGTRHLLPTILTIPQPYEVITGIHFILRVAEPMELWRAQADSFQWAEDSEI